MRELQVEFFTAKKKQGSRPVGEIVKESIIAEKKFDKLLAEVSETYKDQIESYGGNFD